MSEAEPKWKSAVELMICHPADAAVLLLETDRGWALPQMIVEEYVWVRPQRTLSEWLYAQCGMPAITLHCAARTVHEERRYIEAVFALEAQRSESLPENGRFLSQADMSGITLARPEQRPLLERSLEELASGIAPSLRPAWLRRGWFERASAWMAAELERLGYPLAGPVEQLNNWVLSSVLRVATARGVVYLKAVPDWPLFVHEPLFLAGMARLCPEHVPIPLSVEPAERWMLLRDFGLPIWQDGLEDHLPAMIQTFARLQLDMVQHVPQLLEMGCIDRRLGRLALQVDALLADEAALEGLEAEEIRQLREAAPRLQAMCAQLAAYAVPQTLMHGDLHPGNVAAPNGRMLFFDWTDACVAHPFLDMIIIFEQEDEVKRTQLRDLYLEAWVAYEPLPRLLAAWELAETLWALHQAVSYQTIIANLEFVPRMGFRNVIPAYLRMVLKTLQRDHGLPGG